MKLHPSFKPLAVAFIGAVLGATSTMFIAQQHTPYAGVAYAAGVGDYSAGEDDQERIIEAVKHVEPSVVALEVNISGTRVTPADPFGDDGGAGTLSPFTEQASGSGFVYTNDGLIVTNAHVVHGASKITVVFANGDHIPGHLYSENVASDLALVKVDHYAKLPPPVEFAASSGVQKGEWAIAIGEPFALKQTVTLGVVSGFNRDEQIGGETVGTVTSFKGLLQTSAPINPGNSGGPLVDLDGHVIGVNQSTERPAQGIGFAIPADTVKTAVALLLHSPGSGTRASSAGFLGVQVQALDTTLRSQLGYQGEGAAIVAIVSGSPADQAGLQPGEVIQSIDGKPIHSPADVTSIVHGIAAGKSATLNLWDGGTRSMVAVPLTTQPDSSG
jgi:serine protease Do